MDNTKRSSQQASIRPIVTASDIAAMSDEELTQAVIASRTAKLPEYLADKPNPTQRFVYQVGLNGKPLVLDQQRFDQFMEQNDIPENQILYRIVRNTDSLKAQEILERFMYDDLNYIGGKYRGAILGTGTYFQKGRVFHPHCESRKERGEFRIMQAVLNPATAIVAQMGQAWSLEYGGRHLVESMPNFVHAVGDFNTLRYRSNASLYALALGFNVIHHVVSHEINVIDRSAVTVLDRTFSWDELEAAPEVEVPDVEKKIADAVRDGLTPMGFISLFFN